MGDDQMNPVWGTTYYDTSDLPPFLKLTLYHLLLNREHKWFQTIFNVSSEVHSHDATIDDRKLAGTWSLVRANKFFPGLKTLKFARRTGLMM